MAQKPKKHDGSGLRSEARLLPSRRELLSRAAMGGLAAALAACGDGASQRGTIEGSFVEEDLAHGHRLRDGRLPQAASAPRRVEVLICGAGVAGLSAAWRLRRAGFDDLEILDLGPRPGGTARGGSIAGRRHPWGAHYLPVPLDDHRALVAFLDDAGLLRGVHPDGRVRASPRWVVRPPEERLFRDGDWIPGLWPGQPASDERRRFEDLVIGLARRGPGASRPFHLPLARSDASQHALDRLGAAAWCEREGFRSPAMRWFLEYATRDDYGLSLADCSAWALLHYFASRLSPVSGEAGDYLTWPEGNQFLVDRLTEGLGDRLRSGRLVVSCAPGEPEVTVQCLAEGGDSLEVIRARQVVLALPQFVVRRILAGDPAAAARSRFRYGPWVVANLHLDQPPPEPGLPRAWDNVIEDSPSLGYVDASHQVGGAERDAVWTWYLPLAESDEVAARVKMLQTPWSAWRDLVLDDLQKAHPDLRPRVRRIDVRRMGHAMIRPVPGFLFGGDREAAARAWRGVHFAHSDLGGLPLFEEAHDAGVRAAEEVLQARGARFETLR